MSDYISKRQRQVKIGIASYTENQLVLDVIGNTNITGFTTLAASGGITTTGGDLYVGKDLYIKNNTYISGIVSASSFVGSASSLTGVRIGIQSTGTDLGKAETVNFAGPGISSVAVSGGIATVFITGGGVGRLDDLLDVDINPGNKKDQYVLVYNAITGKYVLVNPDVVLTSASTTELTQPGLPGDFVNELDKDLDNRIDIDGGTFS